MTNRIKLDPLAYVLILGVLGIQIYTSFLRGQNVDDVIDASDRAYQASVFGSSDNKGVMHQVFRQNELDRELLKVVLHICAR
ncbi:MAG: hypothetical protein H0T46_00915 [Deltaproteobacteria bacterium]|nr:hypothetical protein [Deltaproteobacteria bacterium]